MPPDANDREDSEKVVGLSSQWNPKNAGADDQEEPRRNQLKKQQGKRTHWQEGHSSKQKVINFPSAVPSFNLCHTGLEWTSHQ